MPVTDEVVNRRHELVYCCKLGTLYHRKRERFFDLCDKATKSATVVLGASLLASYVKDSVPLVGAAVSALGLLSLVYGYTDKKQRHKELADSFSMLLAKVETAGLDPTMEQLNQWHGEMHTISSKEPPSLGTLVVICQNEIAVAEGDLDAVKAIKPYKVFFAEWRDFHEAT